ncbi:hypothetical protein I3760_15G027500 [Carya illinoinensis]|nr:hypothetical protein I3760_15G027500 [Carya illinoinensis]
MTSAEKIREAQRDKGPATILAIGTANTPNSVYQSDYPDLYFHATNIKHMNELKHKFKCICEKSMIRKRFFHLTKEILKANPNIGNYKAPSMNSCQDVGVADVTKTGGEAALKAIKEWGQPISKITHLVFYTMTGFDMPRTGFQLTKFLGLNPSVNRCMIYQQGCYAGGTTLHLAKDLAENNTSAHVLILCSENMTMSFHGPSESHLDILIGQEIFSDDAAAAIISANPDTLIEHTLFKLV